MKRVIGEGYGLPIGHCRPASNEGAGNNDSLTQFLHHLAQLWSEISSADEVRHMGDTFRLNLEGYDNDYIRDVLDGFLESSRNHGRKLAEIRMSQPMFDRMGIERSAACGSYKGVPVMIGDMGFWATIEVILEALQ